MSNIDESAITVWCPCWGEKHLDYLKRFAIPSLLKSGNLPACDYKKIIVKGSTQGPVQPLTRILSEGFEGYPAEFFVGSYPNDHAAMIGSLRETIRHCITTRTRMALLMPDTIIANGGLFNVREYARAKTVSVAAPHLRVNADAFCSDYGYLLMGIEGGVDARNLVSLSKTIPHQSLTDSFSDRDSGTHKGGISLTRIGDDLTTIIHYLPTVYLAWFTESDAGFFDKAADFGSYDHHWNVHLANEGRLRVSGCSDFFFAVELTDSDRNRINVVPGSRLEEDSDQGPFWMRSFVGCLHG